jgi:hypothetical protein
MKKPPEGLECNLLSPLFDLLRTCSRFWLTADAAHQNPRFWFGIFPFVCPVVAANCDAAFGGSLHVGDKFINVHHRYTPSLYWSLPTFSAL